MHAKRRTTAASREPRLEGLRKPSTANTMVKHVMPSTWTPLPMYTARREAYFGGLKTSPETSFHPVLAEDAQHDERDHAGEEEEDDGGVDDGEPVDLVVLPLHLQHVVGEDDLLLLVSPKLKLGSIGVRPSARVAGEQLASVLGSALFVPLAFIPVLDRLGLHLEPHDQHSRLVDLVHVCACRLHVVVADRESEVVVDVELGRVVPRHLCYRVPQLVRHKLLPVLVPEHNELSRWEIVQPHVGPEASPRKVSILIHVLRRPSLPARNLAQPRHVGVELIRRSLRALPCQHLPDVLGQLVLSALRLAEGDVVVVELQRSEV
eukprot:749695-Hanusia_phi.AAC.3